MRKYLLVKITTTIIFCFLFASLSHGATVNVSLGDDFFSPKDLTVNVGDTVLWTNNGGNVHTVTSGSGCNRDGIWDSGNLSPGQTFSFTFTTAGTFPYNCQIHCGFGMVGTVTVNAPCSFSISSSSQTVSFGVTTGSVNVTASSSSCAWTATSNASFITIISGSSGTGNGTVSYSVSANAGTSSRTGTITIAGQTFSVTQAGLNNIQVGSSGAFSTIQSGYKAAVTGDTLQIQAGPFQENDDFTNDVSVVVIGGFDSSFTTTISNNIQNYSVISGTIIISNGTVTVENIIIQ